MMRLLFLIASAWLLIWWHPDTCTVADRFPVVWSTGVGGNGHAYLLVEESVAFAQAFEEAPSYHWTGAGAGYLATITSASEQGFIYIYLNSTAPADIPATYWIGSQKTLPSDPNWFWINGPEEGIQFFNQTFQNPTYHCCCLTYCAWGYRPGIDWEPNDQGGIEDSLALILHVGAYDTPLPWNDASRSFLTQGYLVEFGGYPLESAAITNLSAVDFGVEFPTGSPAHQLSPSLGASRFVRFDFVRISELDGSSGAVVRSLAVDRMEFLGRLVFENDTVSFYSPLGFPSPLQNSSLTFTFVRSWGDGNPTNLSSSSLEEEEAFSGQTLKWSMEIQGWPFAQPTNLLRVDLNISSSSSSSGGGRILLLSNTTSFPNVGDQLLTAQDGNFGVFLAILDNLTVDSNLTTMPRDPVLIGSQLQIFLPSFQKRLFLDPTLAILVQPDEGGDGDDIPLIVGLTVGLAGGLLVMIVIGGLSAVAIAVMWHWWRRRGLVGKAVNWEGKTAAADDTL